MFTLATQKKDEMQKKKKKKKKHKRNRHFYTGSLIHKKTMLNSPQDSRDKK